MKNFAATAAVASAMVIAAALPASADNWDMQSTYPGSLTQLGTLGKRIADEIDKVTGGEIKIKFQEPGAIVPALEVFDAVSSGAVQAGWSTPGYWTGKDSAFALFSAVPFGPSAGEYIAWLKFGGGTELFDEMYAKYNIKGVHCGIIAPEASGWFKEEIKSVDDLKGKKMRFFGLGAKVMEKLGVSTQLLAGGDIFPALELGTIDATEFSMP
ncbi:MAG: C4-dicarboxylate ABC transporter, partial [Hyphomicrobiales bacterium]|nr:C4-dicarboxylate ABC transporter [Hyphomicrobiales bacterium]